MCNVSGLSVKSYVINEHCIERERKSNKSKNVQIDFNVRKHETPKTRIATFVLVFYKEKFKVLFKKYIFFGKMERLPEVEHFLLTKWLTTRRLSRHGDFSESRATMVSYSDE